MNNNSFNHICNPHTPNDPVDTNRTPTWEYHIVPERHSYSELGHSHTGEYQSYGIRVFEVNNMHIHAVAHIHNITTVQSEIERLTERFNRYQLSPIHLEDAIQDYLAAI